MNATKLARNLVRQLIELGVSDFVISPGSRNAPILLALSEAEKLQLVDLHSRLDERGAGYFALGIAKASNNFVAAVCTSGTAAANYLPALLEAYHSGAKLLLITADRPAKLRGTGANQTTYQDGLYSVIKSHDIATIIDLKNIVVDGPVHLNVQFDEPLIEKISENWLDGIKIETEPADSQTNGKLNLTSGVVIIGHERGGFGTTEIEAFCKKLNWPVIAEDPITFPFSISHASLFLQDAQIIKNLKPDWAVVIGRTTLSRSINNFINSAMHQAYFDRNVVNDKRAADIKSNQLPTEISCQPNSDLDKWQMAKSLASKSLNDELGKIKWSEQTAIRMICQALPTDSALFVGASRPTRDIEAVVSSSKKLQVFANRGLSGIDGNISTIFGLGQEFDLTHAIVGDLTLLHDVSAFSNPVANNIRIFVIDNNGGGIFSMLPAAEAADFERLFATPHNLDLHQVLTGFSIKCSVVSNASELSKLLDKEVNGLEVVVIKVPERKVNAEVMQKLTQSVCNAVRIGMNLA